MGRHKSDIGEVELPRRHRGRWVAGVIVVVLIVTAGVYVWSRNLATLSERPAVRCVGEWQDLRVATPASNRQIVEKAALEFAREDATGCRGVKVLVQNDEVTLGQVEAGDAPHIWVANGHSWMAAARASGARIMSQAEIASSPVVLAMPTEAADAHRWTVSGTVGGDQVQSMMNAKRSWQAENHPGWGPFTLRAINTAPSGAGTDAFAALTEATVKDAARGLADAASDPWAHATLRKALTDSPGAGASLPYREARTTDEAMAMASAIVATERDVIEYAGRKPAVAVSAIALGTPSRSVITIAAALSDAPGIKASAFVHALTDVSDEEWEGVGLRPVSGAASEFLAEQGGVRAGAKTSTETSSPDVLDQASRTWRWAEAQGTTLAIMDWSGSMRTTFPGTNRARIDMVFSGLVAGVPYARTGDSFGMSIFSTAEAAIVRPVVPVAQSGTGPQGEPGAIQAALGVQALNPTGGDTPLYEAIVAGMEQIMAGYSEGVTHSLLVVTDGRNDVVGGPSRAEVIERVNALRDPSRPVVVSFVGIGADADMDDLRAIADGTDSVVMQVKNRADLDKVTAQSLFQMR